ncbi:hypothetical protein BDR22DRAFT_969093 [Usnea florida]
MSSNPYTRGSAYQSYYSSSSTKQKYPLSLTPGNLARNDRSQYQGGSSYAAQYTRPERRTSEFGKLIETKRNDRNGRFSWDERTEYFRRGGLFAWDSSDRLISDLCFINNSKPWGAELDPRSVPRNSTWILVGPAVLWFGASTANQKPRHSAHQRKRKQPAAACRAASMSSSHTQHSASVTKMAICAAQAYWGVMQSFKSPEIA